MPMCSDRSFATPSMKVRKGPFLFGLARCAITEPALTDTWAAYPGMALARLTCSVRVVQLRTESCLWIKQLEYQLTPASGKLQRDMRWTVKV